MCAKDFMTVSQTKEFRFLFADDSAVDVASVLIGITNRSSHNIQMSLG